MSLDVGAPPLLLMVWKASGGGCVLLSSVPRAYYPGDDHGCIENPLTQ